MFISVSSCKGGCQGKGPLAPWGGSITVAQHVGVQAEEDEKEEEQEDEEQSEDEEQQEDEEEECWYTELDMKTMDMAALWNEDRQEVNLAGVAGKYSGGDTYGIWFNHGKTAKEWDKRAYKPAWYDEVDDKETFAWKQPGNLTPCEAEWTSTDEVIPRFKLTDKHQVPSEQREAIEQCLRDRIAVPAPPAKKNKKNKKM